MIHQDLLSIIALSLPIKSLYKFSLIVKLFSLFWKLRLNRDYSIHSQIDPLALYKKYFKYRSGRVIQVMLNWNPIDSKYLDQYLDSTFLNATYEPNAERGDICILQVYDLYRKIHEFKFLYDGKKIVTPYDTLWPDCLRKKFLPIEEFDLTYWCGFIPIKDIYFNPFPYLSQIMATRRLITIEESNTVNTRDNRYYNNYTKEYVSEFTNWKNDKYRIFYSNFDIIVDKLSIWSILPTMEHSLVLEHYS